VWTQEHQTAFEEVKARLVADPVLVCPDLDKPFILQTDASDYGIGAIVTQETERGEKVISYSSRTLNGAEKNYSTTEKEFLAILWAIRKLKPYLEGYHFKEVTDHMALKWLNSIESPSGRIARVAAVRLQNCVQERATQRGGRCFVKSDNAGNASRDQEDVGGGSFCSMQLGFGNARKDKDPAAKVSGLRDGG